MHDLEALFVLEFIAPMNNRPVLETESKIQLLPLQSRLHRLLTNLHHGKGTITNCTVGNTTTVELFFSNTPRWRWKTRSNDNSLCFKTSSSVNTFSHFAIFNLFNIAKQMLYSQPSGSIFLLVLDH